LQRLQVNALDQFARLVEKAINVLDAATGLDDAELIAIADYKAAYEAIRSILKRSEEHLPFDLLWGLGHPLEIAVNLGRVSPDCLVLFRYICNALRPETFVTTFEDEAPWIGALEIAARHRNASKNDIFVQDAFSRGATVAQALLRLARRGFEYQINATGASLTDPSFRAICTEIENIVKRVGGVNVANNIFRILHDSGRVYRGLFLYGRSTSQRPQPQDPNIPWHFLYNMALKHLTSIPASLDPPKDWTELLVLAEDLGASLDVQQYSAFESMSISPYLLERAFLDIILYDELFSFPQWSADIALQLVGWWLEALVMERCPFPIAAHQVWRSLSMSLLARAEPYQLTPTHSAEHRSREHPSKITAKLLKALATPLSSVNKRYQTPLDTALRDAPTYPIYRVGADRYIIPPRGIAARAIYERLFALMRAEGDRYLETKLGKALERLTVKILDAAGHRLEAVNGRYSYPGAPDEYEIDLAVGTETYIHLLECKRKVLTSPSRAGGTGSALIDLSRSFLAMLVQMTRHEIALREAGSIKFKNGTELTLNGRGIERIAITMLDHGSLQNRVFIRNIIRAMLNITVHSDDPDADLALRTVNATVRKLRANLQQLAQLAEEEFWQFLRHYDFGTWWLSVDQLSVLSTKGVALWDTLRPIRHMTWQTGDLINEFALAEKVLGRAPSA
jgi:hypothetical protein